MNQTLNPTPNQTLRRLARSDDDAGRDTGHHPGYDIGHHTGHDSRQRRDRGQATTEYALVLLAAALVGVLVVGWATSGGGSAAIGKLFDSAIDSVIDQL